MSITIKDIAQEAGVSVATVSYVLNGTGKVSPEMTENIKKIVAKYNYTPRTKKNALLKQESTKKIMVILNPLFADNTFCLYDSTMIAGCEQAINTQNCHMHLHRHTSDSKLQQAILKEQPDGLILIAQINFKTDLPTIGISNPNTYNQKGDFIRPDDEKIAQLAAELLHQQGRKKTAYLLSIPNHPAFIYRGEIFKKRAKNLNLNATEIAANNDFKNCLNELITKAKNKEIDSVFIPGSDPEVIATCMTLMQNGFTPGEDIKVICCVNSKESFSLMQSSITMIDLNLIYMGSIALNTLLHRIENPNLPFHRILLEPEVTTTD